MRHEYDIPADDDLVEKLLRQLLFEKQKRVASAYFRLYGGEDSPISCINQSHIDVQLIIDKFLENENVYRK